MRHVLVVQIASICNHATAWCKESNRQHRSALCNHGLLYNHVWMRHCSNWDTVNSTGAFGLDLNYFNFMICTLCFKLHENWVHSRQIPNTYPNLSLKRSYLTVHIMRVCFLTFSYYVNWHFLLTLRAWGTMKDHIYLNKPASFKE